MSPATAVDPVAADMRRTFRDLPQPVAVVTGRSPSGQPIGMTVSSLTSASLAPPLVIFCPALTSRSWEAARVHGSFAVNILGHEEGELAARFAGSGDRFAGVATLRAGNGLPMLAEALTVLLCDVDDEYPAGDHTVVLGRVRAVRTLHDGPGLDTVTLRRSAPSRGQARLRPCG